jgi:flagellar hook-length control protein FliK
MQRAGASPPVANDSRSKSGKFCRVAAGAAGAAAAAALQIAAKPLILWKQFSAADGPLLAARLASVSRLERSIVSSVTSGASSIFPASRPLPGPRGPGQEPPAQGNDEFAALLDNEPAAPAPRAGKRRDDVAPANGQHKSQPQSSQPARETSDAESAQTGAAAETPVQPAAPAAENAGQADGAEVADTAAQAELIAAIQPDAAAAVAIKPADAEQTETAEAPAAEPATAAVAPPDAAIPVAVTVAAEIAVTATPPAPEIPGIAPAAAPEAGPAPETVPAAAHDGAESPAAAVANPATPVPATPGAEQQAPAGSDASDGEIVPAAKPAPAPAQTAPRDAAAPEFGNAAGRPVAQAPAAPATQAVPAAASAPPAGPAPAVRPAGPANDSPASDGSGALKIASDAMQNLGANAAAPALGTAPAQSTAAAHAAAAAAPAQPNPAAVPIAGLAVEIAAQALSGKRRFEIRLDPPELGRIDVRLEIDRDGNVSSKLVVERSETLDMLRRDAPQLERALQQAGLKTSDNTLEFSLRQQGAERDDGAPARGNARASNEEAAAADLPQINYGRRLTLGGGIDIRV